MGTCLRPWPFLQHGKWAAVCWKGLENTGEDALTLRQNACLYSLLLPTESSMKKGRATKGMEAPKAGLAAPTRQEKPVHVCDMNVGSCPPSLQGGC